jgi:phosphonate transport system substrate-binding protein
VSIVHCKLLVVLGILLCMTVPICAAAEAPLIFGLLPVVSPQRLLIHFDPLRDYLARQLHKPVRLETAGSYAEFFHRTNERQYDILFTAPHFYYVAQRQAGYRVLVRMDAPTMRAVIVARKDSNIKSLNDLRGKQFATADPLALSTAMVRAHLSQYGIDPDKDLTLVATPTHNSSLLSTMIRVTDASALMRLPYNNAKTQVKNNMRIIAETAGTPHMPVSVSSSVSDRDAAIIENALLNLTSSEEGRTLLKKLGWPGFTKTSPAEYDKMEWAVKEIE